MAKPPCAASARSSPAPRRSSRPAPPGPRAAAAAPAKAAVVALALWSDPVFRSEAEGAASVLAGATATAARWWCGPTRREPW